MIAISKRDARLYLLRHQHLYNPRQLETDTEIVNFIKEVGCIQYDPLNKTARNADLVLQSRCRNYSEETLYRLLYKNRKLIDWWDKNMSIWVVTDWPHFSRKRAVYMRRYKEREKEFNPVRDEIIHKIREKGCLSSKDVWQDKKVHWAWSPTDIGRAVLESLYHCGELVIHHKDGTRKYYGLSTELLPESVLRMQDPHLADDEHDDWYVYRRIRAVGLLWGRSSDAWLGMDIKTEARYRSIQRLIDKNLLTEVKIDQINETFYMPTDKLDLLNDNKKHNEISIIAPLDNLMWDRKLISKLFNFNYTWEVYTPAKARKYGYYVLPLLYGDSFIGRFEPVVDREKNTLVLDNWWWEPGIKLTQKMTNALARCFCDFVQFLNVSNVSLANSLTKDTFKWTEKCIMKR